MFILYLEQTEFSCAPPVQLTPEVETLRKFRLTIVSLTLEIRWLTLRTTPLTFYEIFGIREKNSEFIVNLNVWLHWKWLRIDYEFRILFKNSKIFINRKWNCTMYTEIIIQFPRGANPLPIAMFLLPALVAGGVQEKSVCFNYIYVFNFILYLHSEPPGIGYEQ